MIFLRICWVVTLLAASIAAFGLFVEMQAAKSAPQEGAAAALAAAICIIPYVFTRAVEAMTVRKP